MTGMTRIPKQDNAELLDMAVGEMQDGLAACLPWLDWAFGRAERLVRRDAGMRRVYTPNVYAGGDDYRCVLPDARIGNFCFFWVPDPQAVYLEAGVPAALRVTLSVVFWFDHRTVAGAAGVRNREAVKRQALDALNGGFVMRHGRFTAGRLYELAENIYEGFSIDEVDNQFLMHPYGGFRVEGELRVEGSCA